MTNDNVTAIGRPLLRAKPIADKKGQSVDCANAPFCDGKGFIGVSDQGKENVMYGIYFFRFVFLVGDSVMDKIIFFVPQCLE